MAAARPILQHSTPQQQQVQPPPYLSNAPTVQQAPGYYPATPQHGAPKLQSPFGYPQSMAEVGVTPQDEFNPIPFAILLHVGGFAIACLVFCPLYDALALLQHPLYFYFARSTMPVALMIIIILVLFWYYLPRFYKVRYPKWDAGCCSSCPLVPGCCCPGCPACPTVPGCPSIAACPPCSGVDCAGSCPVLCPTGCCGSCFACCPGLDMCCANPLSATKTFFKSLKTNTEFLLVMAVSVVLVYVWAAILRYYNMEFLDLIPGLRNVVATITAPVFNLVFSFPEHIHIPTVALRLPTIYDADFVIRGIGTFLGAPPLALLATVIGTIFLLMLLMAIFANYADMASKEGVSSGSIWGNACSIWGYFLLAIGTIFIIVSVPVAREARAAQSELFDECKTGPKTRNLFVASQAMQSLRQTDSCAKAESVESCAGYQETPYTGLLKYMEITFQCSGFCYDHEEVPSVPGVSLAQLSEVVGQGASRRNVVGRATQVSLASRIAADIPPALFSKDQYLVSCDGMAARDMVHYVGRIGDEIYWQGVLMVTMSIGVLVLRLMGIPWPSEGKRVQFNSPSQPCGYGAVGY